MSAATDADAAIAAATAIDPDPVVRVFRTEGGRELPLVEPIDPEFLALIRTRDLVEIPGHPLATAPVDEDTEVTVVPMPAPSDDKGAWIAYAVSTGRIEHAAASKLTHRKLVEQFGTPTA